MMPKLGNNLDIPFEEGPPGQTMQFADANVSGGLVVMGAVIPIEDDPKPALVFRFATPTGGFYPPTILVMDDDQVGKLTGLVSDAVSASRKAVRKAKSA